MKKFILVSIIFLKVTVFTWFFSGAPVYAVTVDGLYSAQIKVEDRDKLTFEKALRDALVLVLAKNTPATAEEILLNPHMAVDLQRGHKYAEQFSYQIDVKNQGDLLQEQQLFLRASFPASVIKDFLQRGGLSLWPANRPATLFIPVVKMYGALSLNDEKVNAQLNLDEAVKEAAFKYGIALVPQLELQQVPQGYVNAFWNWDVTEIDSATEHIDKDAVLTSRMAVTSNGVRGGWMLQQGDVKRSIDIQARTTAGFIDKGFAWLSELWSKQYAVNLQHSGNEQLLIVSGIDSHEKYMQLLAYLNGLDIVAQVYMLQLESDKVTMAVALKSDLQQFERTLQRNRHIRAQSGDSMATTYHWH